jgi:hypothetical protein
VNFEEKEYRGKVEFYYDTRTAHFNAKNLFSNLDGHAKRNFTSDLSVIPSACVNFNDQYFTSDPRQRFVTPAELKSEIL